MNGYVIIECITNSPIQVRVQQQFSIKFDGFESTFACLIGIGK